MAKARTYARDSRGRFASGSGSATAKASGGSRAKGTMGPLSARTSLRRSREKLATNQTSAQRGAVTRASKKLAALRLEARRTMPARAKAAGVMGGKVQRRPIPGRSINARNTITPSGGLKAAKSNVRPYRPKSFEGQWNQTERRVDRSMKDMTDAANKASKARKDAISLNKTQNLQFARMQASAIADRRKKGVERDIAGAVLRSFGGRDGTRLIQQRAARAAAAAARGSRAGAKALGIYDNQLAAMGPGKSKRGKNNLVPGPRNKQAGGSKKRGGGPRKGGGGRKKKG